MGYINPDETTFAFLRGRQYAPAADAWDRAVGWWSSIASDSGSTADDERVIDVTRIAPVVTWGTNPGQSVAVDEPIPDPRSLPGGERDAALEALQFMWLDHRGLAAGRTPQGHHGGEAGHHLDAAAAEREAIDGVALAQRSGLYYAGDGSSATSERELVKGVCYCCKVALATTPRGGLLAAWRQVYSGNIRDIAFMVLARRNALELVRAVRFGARLASKLVDDDECASHRLPVLPLGHESGQRRCRLSRGPAGCREREQDQKTGCQGDTHILGSVATKARRASKPR